MDALDQRIRLLHKLRPDERLAAVAAALPAAPEAERETLALLLTELAAKPSLGTGLRRSRRRAAADARVADHALTALARTWAGLPQPSRRLALAAGRGRWVEAVEALEPGQALDAGESLATLIADSGDPALVPVLPPIIGAAESRAAAAASRTLLALALRLGDLSDAALLGLDERAAVLAPALDPEAPIWTPADVESLLGAVAQAVETFDQHRRKEVLLAALVLLEGPRRNLAGRNALAKLATDPDSPASRTLRSAFRRARAPLARQRAWLWLREEAVALACTDRIARAPTIEDHAIVLSLAHLARAPARARHLALVPIATIPAPQQELPPGVRTSRRLHPTGPVPPGRVMTALPAACRRAAPGLVASLDADHTTRALALDPLLMDPDSIARLNAATTLQGEHARDYCFDAEPAIARTAAFRQSPVGVAESDRLRSGDSIRRRAAAALLRSPHPSVRQLGADDQDRLTPGAKNQLQLLAARRLHRSEPEAFADWVRERVDADRAHEGVGAIMVARRIGAVPAIEAVLLRILSDSLRAPAAGASRLAATAVAALGDLRSPRSEGVLAECLTAHPDARVRANAAEALGRTPRPETRDALPARTADEPHHRVRASVLRAVLQPWPEAKPQAQNEIRAETQTEAADSLSAMLSDPRPEQRLAGVWVVQRSLRSGLEGRLGRRWDRLAGRVRWLADEDTDTAVRTRAAVVRNRLDAAFAGLGPSTAGGAA